MSCCHGGRCTSKIDVHAHIMPAPGDFYEEWKTTPGEWITLDRSSEGGVNMMSHSLGRSPKLFRPVDVNLYDTSARIVDMDRDGVRMQVLSVPPAMWRYDLEDQDVAYRWCSAVNRYLSDLTTANPDRFAAIGIVPLQFPEIAARVAKEAVGLSPGMVGVQVGTHVPREPAGRWDLGDVVLTPFFAACEEHSVPVMIHPWYMCCFQQEGRQTPLPGGGSIGGKGAYWAPWLVGMGAEEANCILSITASGLLHRFPTLKVLVTHGGGGWPALKGRVEQGIRCRRDWVWPVLGNHFEALGETERHDTLDDYMSRIFVDSITHDPAILDLILSIHGASNVLFGSDYPFPLGDVTGFLGDGVFSGHIVEQSEHREGIFFKNASSFFLSRDKKKQDATD